MAILILAAFSRILSFARFIACASLVGIVGRKERAFLAALLSATLYCGVAPLASGGLFLNYFTHSEVANGLFLIALYFSIRGGIAASIGLTGVMLLCKRIHGRMDCHGGRGNYSYPNSSRERRAALNPIAHAALGICIGGPFVGIVIGVMLSNPEFGNAVTFDYTEMLAIVAPHHFFK